MKSYKIKITEREAILIDIALKRFSYACTKGAYTTEDTTEIQMHCRNVRTKVAMPLLNNPYAEEVLNHEDTQKELQEAWADNAIKGIRSI